MEQIYDMIVIGGGPPDTPPPCTPPEPGFPRWYWKSSPPAGRWR